MTQSVSSYWLDLVVAQILAQHPTGEIIVSSGISPSGPYHIGHFREALTADMLRWGLTKAGRTSRHLHFVDNFDPLRRRYDFLPASYDQYVGWPIYLVPDPQDCHASYADHFFASFKLAAEQMGIQMEVHSSVDEYRAGRYDELMDQAIEHQQAIRLILQEQSRRELDDQWTPVQVMEKDKTFRNITAAEWPEVRKLIPEGKVKLSWRADWPARWRAFGVTAEPYGKEHATKGGSYDTGKAIIEQVWGGKAPYPLPFETINLAGQSKKMSSSLGNVVTPEEALSVMPPEILRYFVIRSRPNRVLHFDTGLGLYNLIDEFSRAEAANATKEPHPFVDAYRAAATTASNTISSIPFSHLVAVYQAALREPESTLEILARTGYAAQVKQQRETLVRELSFVRSWLDKYAPDEVKFELKEQLPSHNLSSGQRQFLSQLAGALEATKSWDGQVVHEAIYAQLEATGLKPHEGFAAIYQVVLGQDHGPKAGWFLASLERNWLIKRLKLEA